MKILILLVLIFICITSSFAEDNLMAPFIKSREEKLREKILEVFDKDKLILLAYELIQRDIFIVAKNFLQYTKTDETPTYDEFYVWMMKNVKYREYFLEGDLLGIYQKLVDNRFTEMTYIEIQKNYELLEALEKNAP